jgi:hypothetical protein
MLSATPGASSDVGGAEVSGVDVGDAAVGGASDTSAALQAWLLVLSGP